MLRPCWNVVHHDFDRWRSAREDSTKDNRDVTKAGAVAIRASISGVIPFSRMARRTAEVSRERQVDTANVIDHCEFRPEERLQTRLPDQVPLLSTSTVALAAQPGLLLPFGQRI